MSARAKIAAGNWKMNGLPDALDQVRAIAGAAGELPGITTLLCLPATLIAGASGIGLPVGGQDCHAAAKGAHTGDLSAEMLAAAGAGYVIVGHSESRADHGETSEMVATKAQAAWRAGLTAIVCIGETDDENRAGQTLDMLRAQIAGSLPAGATAGNTILAYEPVWAIGTGRTPSPEDIARTHGFIRAELAARGARAIPVLYGGSVNAGNAAEIFAVADVDGGLVGGASLKAADFVPIMKALAASGGNT